MFLSTALCFCVFLIVVILCLKPNTKNGKRLPGPTPLPLLGNLLQIGFQSHVTFTKWAKRYGPIYGIKLGLKDAIVVSDVKLITELFNETASSGRMSDNVVMLEFSKGPFGVMNSSGLTWEAQRKFTTKTLRSFGFGKETMESMILEEVKIMLDWLRNQEGLAISGKRIFNFPMVNPLLRIVNGKRFEWENGRPAFSDAMDGFLKELLNVTFNGLFFAPFLKSIAPEFLGWNRYVESITPMLNMFQDTIENHKETFDATELRDYMDHHLLKIQNETNPKSSFYKDTGHANLLGTNFNLFFLGSESSSNILSWTLLYLSEYQSIQKSMQMEIDQVVGSTTLPSLSNRDNMPYCEAVISEILRITSATPLGAPHGMISDLVFHGYYIPKGATVFPNLYAVHHDLDIWGDPENFRPERFLNQDKTKFIRNEALIPFAEGKRKCIGGTHAMNTIFLFVTGICQQFNILPNPNNKGTADFEPELGLILPPKPFHIVFSS